MFCFTLTIDFTSFRCWEDIRFRDDHNTLSVKVEVPQSMKDNEMNDIEGVFARQSEGETKLK